MCNVYSSRSHLLEFRLRGGPVAGKTRFLNFLRLDSEGADTASVGPRAFPTGRCQLAALGDSRMPSVLQAASQLQPLKKKHKPASNQQASTPQTSRSGCHASLGNVPSVNSRRSAGHSNVVWLTQRPGRRTQGTVVKRARRRTHRCAAIRRAAAPRRRRRRGTAAGASAGRTASRSAPRL